MSWVNYPGLKSNQYHELAIKYLPNGQGAILTFGVKGDSEAIPEFVEALNLFSLLANVGDSKSLIIHPASTTHQQLTDEEQLASGVTKDLVRLSVGTESSEDIIKDLEQALNKIK